MISKVIFLLSVLAGASLAEEDGAAPSPSKPIIPFPTLIFPTLTKPPSPTFTKPPSMTKPPSPTFTKPPSMTKPPSPTFTKPPSMTKPPSPTFTKPPSMTKPPVPAPTMRPPEVPNSHLTCFKGKVAKASKFSAMIKLTANEWQSKYSVAECKVYYKKIDFCVPSTKEIQKTTAEFPSLLYGVRPQQLSNDFICYRISCDSIPTLPDGQGVGDQFGLKLLEFETEKKFFKVCVPAWKLDKEGKPIILPNKPVVLE